MSFPDYAFTDTNNGQLNPALLHEEIEALSLGSVTLLGVNSDTALAQFTVATDVEPSAGDKTAIDGAVAAHNGIFYRNWEIIPFERELEPVIPGASKVLANDRPAVEIQAATTGFAAIQAVWNLPLLASAEFRCCVSFILKAAGTGSNVRIAVRMKTDGEGDDSSGAFASSAFVVVPVTHTTVGEVFCCRVYLDASSANLGDALAIQVGRDGSNELGAGTNDDVNKAIQIIGFRMEAR